MPQVELCLYCKKTINPEADEYVVVTMSIEGGIPRRVAHPECVKSQSPAPVP